jgi:hypothetical protein
LSVSPKPASRTSPKAPKMKTSTGIDPLNRWPVCFPGLERLCRSVQKGPPPVEIEMPQASRIPSRHDLVGT